MAKYAPDYFLSIAPQNLCICYGRSFNSPDLFEVFTLTFSLGAEAGVKITAGGPRCLWLRSSFGAEANISSLAVLELTLDVCPVPSFSSLTVPKSSITLK